MKRSTTQKFTLFIIFVIILNILIKCLITNTISGWTSLVRKDNNLTSSSTPSINLTYIPTVGPDGTLAINTDGDLEVTDPSTKLPFVCQFDGEFI